MITILNRIFPSDISNIIFNYIRNYELEIIIQPKLYILDLHLDNFNYITYLNKIHNFEFMIDSLKIIENILYFANKYNYNFDNIFQYNINTLTKILKYQKPNQKNIFVKIIINKILLITEKNIL